MISQRLASLRTNRSGQDLLEYALLGGLVASCAIAIFPAIATTGGYFSHVMSVLSAAISQTAGAR